MTKKSVLKDIRYSKKLALAGLSAAAAFGATTVAHVVHAETYTVQAGDTLSEIAENHNTTVDNLAQTNNISNPDFILLVKLLKLGERYQILVLLKLFKMMLIRLTKQ